MRSEFYSYCKNDLKADDIIDKDSVVNVLKCKQGRREIFDFYKKKNTFCCILLEGNHLKTCISIYIVFLAYHQQLYMYICLCMLLYLRSLPRRRAWHHNGSDRDIFELRHL